MRRAIALLVALVASGGCKRGAEKALTFPHHLSYAGTKQASATPLVDDAGQWAMPQKDYSFTRFSTLSDINASNVANLKLAWTFSTGRDKGQEASPIVVGDTMYVVTPFPNHVFALDLTKSGATKWVYKPEVQESAKGVACCDLVNRGVMYAQGKIILNTLDNQTIAIDAASGTEVWKARLGDINKGETITMSPLVVKDKVLVGNAGGEFGVRGWLCALDLATGRTVWKAFHTGEDKDCLIGPDFKPHYAKDQGKDLGKKTWMGDQYEKGGATAWGWISYDPKRNLIYYGTGNPGPWNPELRPGDNKWSATIFARDADTGMAKWAYQFQPHDVFDYDGVNENTLLTLNIGGRPRDVLVRAERNGYIYVLDRDTGEVVSADPYVYITSTTGIDLKTGRLRRSRRRSRATRWRRDRSVPASQVARTGSRLRTHHAPDCSISPPRTSAWTSKASRRITSPARHTSERTTASTQVPAAIAAN